MFTDNNLAATNEKLFGITSNERTEDDPDTFLKTLRCYAGVYNRGEVYYELFGQNKWLSQRARTLEDVLMAFVINGLPENIGSTIMLNFPVKLSWSYIYNICSGLQWRKISAEGTYPNVLEVDAVKNTEFASKLGNIGTPETSKVRCFYCADVCALDAFPIVHINDEKIGYKALLDSGSAEGFKVYSIDVCINKLGEHIINTGNAAPVVTTIYRNGMSLKTEIKKKIKDVHGGVRW
ncbi:uncharacterized protein VNE69_02181 [Vairimorpha necatrix]|uniref:Uncharacterized protein n=1 Tax=Vairimorpha necatrix TaxID=6039 RepID=A0AAX4J9K9_9MICR